MNQELEGAAIVSHLEAEYKKSIVVDYRARGFGLANFCAEKLEAGMVCIKEVKLGKHPFLDSIGRVHARDVDNGESLVIIGDLDENALKEAGFPSVQHARPLAGLTTGITCGNLVAYLCFRRLWSKVGELFRLVLL